MRERTQKPLRAITETIDINYRLKSKSIIKIERLNLYVVGPSVSSLMICQQLRNSSDSIHVIDVVKFFSSYQGFFKGCSQGSVTPVKYDILIFFLCIFSRVTVIHLWFMYYQQIIPLDGRGGLGAGSPYF